MVETRSSRAKTFLHNEPVGSHPRNRGKQATGIVRVLASTVKARSAKSTSRSRSPPTSQKSLELATTVPTPSPTTNKAPTKAPVKFDTFLQQTLADRRTNGSTTIPFAFPGFYAPPLATEIPTPKPSATTSDGKGRRRNLVKQNMLLSRGLGLRKHSRMHLLQFRVTQYNTAGICPRPCIVLAFEKGRYPKLQEVLDGLFCKVPLYGLGWTITSKELHEIAGPGSRREATDSYKKMVSTAWKHEIYTRDIPIQFMAHAVENFNDPDNYGCSDVFLMIAQNTTTLLPWISNKENRERSINAAMTMLKFGPEKRPQLRWHRKTRKDFYAITPPEVAYPSSSTL